MRHAKLHLLTLWKVSFLYVRAGHRRAKFSRRPCSPNLPRRQGLWPLPCSFTSISTVRKLVINYSRQFHWHSTHQGCKMNLKFISLLGGLIFILASYMWTHQVTLRTQVSIVKASQSISYTTCSLWKFFCFMQACMHICISISIGDWYMVDTHQCHQSQPNGQPADSFGANTLLFSMFISTNSIPNVWPENSNHFCMLPWWWHFWWSITQNWSTGLIWMIFVSCGW